MTLKKIDDIMTLSVELEDALTIRQLKPIEERVKPELLAIIRNAATDTAVRGVAVGNKDLPAKDAASMGSY